MRSARLLTALAALFLLPGCIGFQKSWHAAKKEFPAPHKEIQGAWIGSWTSGHNAHTGKLRCIVTETAPGKYQFHYWATWAKVISAGFEIECVAAENDNKWTFSGDMDLGKLGGEFSHEGKATPDSISAKWRSARGDHGTFELKRPEG
jgi:hypothetical protein